MKLVKFVLLGMLFAVPVLAMSRHTPSFACPSCGPVPDCDPNAPICPQ